MKLVREKELGNLQWGRASLGSAGPGVHHAAQARCGRGGKRELPCAVLPVRAEECQARQRAQHGIWRKERVQSSSVWC